MATLTKKSNKAVDVKDVKFADKGTLRSLVKTYYDIQDSRIRMGQRIVQNYKIKMGAEPSKKDSDSLDDKAQKLLSTILKEYKRLADGMTSANVREKVKALEKNKGILSSIYELSLIEQYNSLSSVEENIKKSLDTALGYFPIWTEYMSKISGVGTLMGSVIISEFDIHTAKHISSFWKYAGLDVVIDPETGDGKGRSRIKDHLVERTYISKKTGKEETKLSITFNPFLKCKLVGVLAPSFIKVGKKYRKVYDDYKNRLRMNPKYADYTDKHTDNMARRYTVKMFLKELWLAWRELEGYPYEGDWYEEKVLGRKHGEGYAPIVTDK